VKHCQKFFVNALQFTKTGEMNGAAEKNREENVLQTAEVLRLGR